MDRKDLIYNFTGAPAHTKVLSVCQHIRLSLCHVLWGRLQLSSRHGAETPHAPKQLTHKHTACILYFARLRVFSSSEK